MEPNERRPAGSSALGVACGFTIAYLLGLAALLWKQGRTSADILALNLSELGDFLAGVSAPLAFLWLVAAVFIQRRELELTRGEFEMNRQVTMQQAEEAKRQAQFIGEQTDLLRAESHDRERSRMDALYEEKAASLQLALEDLLQASYGVWGSTNLANAPVSIPMRFLQHGPTVASLLNGLGRLKAALIEKNVSSADKFQSIDRVGELLEAIVSLLPVLTSLAFERASNHPYALALERLNEVKEIARKTALPI